MVESCLSPQLIWHAHINVSFHVYVDSVFDQLAREREELAAQFQGGTHESEEDSSPAFEDIMKFWERISNQVRTRTRTRMFQWKDEHVLNL